MVAPSSVRYARVDGVSLAYQTLGDGPTTIVAIPPMAQNIELMWERPEYRRMLERVGSFARLVHFDKRGTGASDITPHMPSVDERVEDLRAVMDDAEVDRADLLGVSEGGPVALAFAATYPERVRSVVLVSSAARIIGDETDEQRAHRRAWFDRIVDRWGTDDTVILDVFAPTAAADPSYRAWEPRYERQSATPAAVRELLDMLEVVDVRPLLPSVSAPVLVLHRRDDPVVPVELARETVAAIAGARLVELDGVDHAPHIGDVDAWLDHVQELTTGAVSRHRSPDAGRIAVQVMGGFRVLVGDEEVPLPAWGSRQARQLCKRLAVAAGTPVPRDELIDMLWPDGVDLVRLGARLSVVLSNVRRVLRGGLLADGAAVRLDLDAVSLDLHLLTEALRRGDDAAAVALHHGPVLPEDPYEDWANEVRDRVTSALIGARRRLASQAEAAGDLDAAVAHLSAILELDRYDERAHEVLVRTLVAAARHGDAVRAEASYRDRMAELGVRPQTLLS